MSLMLRPRFLNRIATYRRIKLGVTFTSQGEISYINWKLVVPLVVFLCAPMYAQTGAAGIAGVVHDPTGSVVPAAHVVISSTSQGEVRSIDTNSAGVFSAPALIPGK